MDEKNLEPLIADYVSKNFYCKIFSCVLSAAYTPPIFVDDVDFLKLQAQSTGETFSEMLLRLIDESGEKNSVVYARANIDRRHFSKIINHKDYQPSKQTALAFAVALKLNFEQTQKLLAAAGYTLSNVNLSDVIISFFIEYKIFDVDLVNQSLYKYKLPLLGS